MQRQHEAPLQPPCQRLCPPTCTSAAQRPSCSDRMASRQSEAAWRSGCAARICSPTLGRSRPRLLSTAGAGDDITHLNTQWHMLKGYLGAASCAGLGAKQRTQRSAAHCTSALGTTAAGHPRRRKEGARGPDPPPPTPDHRTRPLTTTPDHLQAAGLPWKASGR